MTKKAVEIQADHEELEEEGYYGKYTINSGGGAVTINLTISGNGNAVSIMAGQPSPPNWPPK